MGQYSVNIESVHDHSTDERMLRLHLDIILDELSARKVHKLLEEGDIYAAFEIAAAKSPKRNKDVIVSVANAMVAFKQELATIGS